MNRTQPSLSLPTIARMLLGAVWIAGAMWNAVVTLPGASDAWSDLGTNATFRIYRWFFDSIAGGAPVVWALMLVVAELTLGLLLLRADPWARYGLLLSTAWCVFLFFLIWPWTLSTIIFLFPSILLLRYPHPLGLGDLLTGHGGRMAQAGKEM
jgi:hypothetical protein